MEFKRPETSDGAAKITHDASDDVPAGVPPESEVNREEHQKKKQRTKPAPDSLNRGKHKK